MQVIDLLTNISNGMGQWMPVQTGIILAATDVSNLPLIVLVQVSRFDKYM